MGALGALVFLALPMLVGLMIGERGLSEQQSGLVASSYFATYFLSSSSSYLWINKIPPRKIAGIAYLCMATGLGSAALATNAWQLAFCMAVAGLGGGSLFSLATTIISRRPEADRDFGWLLATQQLVAAGFLFASADWSLQIALACISGIGFFMLASLPGIAAKERAVSGPGGAVTQSTPQSGVWAALAILMINFMALSALWAFVERIGATGGLDSSALGSALSLSMLAGLAGALLVTRVADRWGRQIPLWSSATAFALVCAGYELEMSWLLFLAVTSMLSFTWNFALAYQMGVVALLDGRGRYSALIPAAQSAGAMLGPVLGGALVTDGQYTELLWVVATLVTATLLGFSLLVRNRAATTVSEG